MRNLILALALVVLCPVFLLAAETVSLHPGVDPVSVQVTESSASRIVLAYDLSSFVTRPIDINGARYFEIGAGEESNLLEAGLPGLPHVPRSVIIPDDADMAVRVTGSHYVDFPGTPIAPSKGNLTRDVDPASVPYTFDRFYGGDEWYPRDLATTREPYIMRDFRGTVVDLFPFQYNPRTQTLRVYDRVVVELVNVGPAKTNPLIHRPAAMNAEFRKIYQNHFLNYEQAATRYPPVDDVGSMLVICYGDFMAAAQPLVDWKNQMGVPCEMVSVATAGGSAANINTYIENYYNAHDLAFVLLVGDAAQCPSLTVSNLSDPSYALITADTYPDLLIGRLSAENVAQVETQVLRTVEYEKRPQAGAAWYHKGTGIGSEYGPGDDNEYDWEHIDNIRTDLLGFTYTSVDQIYGAAATAQMVTNALNEGRSIINYCGHGDVTLWSTTGFSNTNVNALVNDNMLPFICSVACYNGQFGSTTCFGEAWLRASHNGEPTGAIGAYMSTISQSWDPPMDAEDEFDDLLVGTAVTGARRTFGGICFNGSSHMMDQYGSDGANEYYHWTVFGDPSLRVRTATPIDVVVGHLPVLYPNMTSFDVTVSTTGDAPVEGALCAIYGNGVLYGHAFTGSGGSATIPISGTLPVGEMVSLTVTGFNTMPYVADIQVIFPVTYSIVPPTIPVAATSNVTVTVWDQASQPKPNVDITIDGWGIAPVVDTTDALGQAHLSVTPPYGEDLTVIGREIGQGYNCLETTLPVTGGVALGSADIHGDVPLIGLFGALVPGWNGVVTGTTVQSFFDIYLEGCGLSGTWNSGSSTVVEVPVLPAEAGLVHAALAKNGYNVYLEDIVVAMVYGQMSGEVYEVGDGPIVGAKLKGYPAGADTTGATPVFMATSGTGGAYTVTGDLEVGYYDVYVAKFAYLPLVQKVLITVGPNDEDFYLDTAPAGVVSGTVTEVVTGRPLSATIKVYRADTMELYAQTTSDSLSGGAYSVELPYFNYAMNVRAYHHIPENQGISVNDPTETVSFELERTLANILVMSDGVTKGETVKVDKTGAVLATFEGVPEDAKSAAQIATDLIALGYDVTQETAAGSNPATWLNYDFIVSASGDNTSPVESATYRAALESYVAAGGKLLVEGGEVGYDSISYPGYPTFAANVLHIASWQHDSAGNLRAYDMTHPVTTTPNTIGTITFTYVNYGDEDSNTPLANAHMVCDWSMYPGLSGVIVYDDNPDPASGQMVFFEFDYLAAGTGRAQLLENVVAYLMAPESTPTGGIGGMAFLEGQSDNSGIKVTATPGGNFAYTDVSGHYEIGGLYAGTYTVQATKAGWSIGQVTGVHVSEGQLTGGVSFLLYAIQEYSQCVSPALAIPDNVPAGVYSTLTFAEDVTITDVEIYVNITHTYIGDLIVEVRSPQGTTVRLHDRAGGSADNIVGWYDSQLAVGGPGALTDFIGQHSNGDWRLWVSDNAGVDIGTLNTWCVKVVGGAPTGVPETGDGPATYVLRGVSPNPFNPVTKVSYGMPESGAVTISVYSVSGQLVRVLVDGEQDAGYHSVVWDGRDEGGAPVASGVYFCRMNALGFHDAAKMVLLK